jgi:hypothetical protein
MAHPETTLNLDILPYAEVCDSTVESGTVVIAEPVPTAVIVSKKKIVVIAMSTKEKIIRSSRRLTGMIAMSRTTYDSLAGVE